MNMEEFGRNFKTDILHLFFPKLIEFYESFFLKIRNDYGTSKGI